jgi:GT2 family glycosyltransferase
MDHGRRTRGLASLSPGGTWVGELELRDATDIVGISQHRAMLLVRWAGRPVASIVVPVTGGRVTASAVRDALHRDRNALARLGLALLADWLDDTLGPVPESPVPPWSVIVCTRDRPDDLRRCLDSLLAMALDGGEIVVVDNGSSDECTRRVVEARPLVRYVREDRPGLNWARARGAREATGEVLLYTDDDVVVSADWVDHMLRPFAEPRVAAVTGLVVPLELETHAQELFEVYGGLGRGYLERRWEATALHPSAAGVVGAGACMALRRSLVVDMRLFDVELDAGTRALTGGDTYAFYRLLDAGYLLVYTPEAVVRHRHRRDHDALRRALVGYSVGGFVMLSRALVEHRDFMALVVAARWLIDDHLRGFFRAARRRPDRMPLRLLVPYLAGCATGVARYAQLRRAERAQPARREALDAEVHALDQDPEPAAASYQVDAAHIGDPRVAVIIPSRNRSVALERTLGGLARQTLPSACFEVIVSLDGSSDESEAMLARWRQDARLPRLRWRNAPQAGQATARNEGARMAAAEVLVFLDDDVVPEAGCLATHLQRHDEGARVVVGDAPIERSGTRSMHLDSVWAWWEDFYHRRALPGRSSCYRDLCAGNFSIRRKDFFTSGGFDTRFTGYGGEDFELGYRLLRQGVPILVEPRARARHWHRTSAAGMVRATRQEARGDVLLGTLHPELRSNLRVMRPPQARGRPLFLLAMHAPWLGDVLLAAGRGLLPLFERLNDRPHWAAVMKAQRNYAYWRGVRDVLGSREALEEFRAAGPAPHVADWDLSDGPSRPPPLDVHADTLIRVRHRGEPIGEMLVPGPAELPLPCHLRAAILETPDHHRLLAPLVARRHGGDPLVADALEVLAPAH